MSMHFKHKIFKSCKNQYSNTMIKTSSCIFSFLLLICFLVVVALGGTFDQEFDVTWGYGRVKILENGQLLTLSLDRSSGSGFKSKKQYMFAKIDMKIKLVPGNSAGTATTYYLSSVGSAHDEIDFEFLGNVSGEPYTLHTNVYAQGKGDKEQQFHLWFDPTKDFHTYSILWNPRNIIFLVDGTPIRQYKNLEATNGIPYPKNQAMWLYSSLWNAEEWATRGGLVRTDWSKAPFIASYRNYNAQTCVMSSCSKYPAANSWFTQSVDNVGLARMKWVQRNYMIYNYCTDYKRFPQGFPHECTLN